MLNFQCALAADLRESAKIEKKRQYEEERKARIFNTKQRLFGVDLDVLKKQIAEKKEREEEEKAREKAYLMKQLRDAEIAKTFERQIQENKKRLQEEINEFRENFQRPETRREFDLYDPDGLKKSLPARLLDDDPRLTISSAQKFEGEDVTTEARKKVQKEQQRAWLEQQMLERCRADQERKDAEKMYQEAMIARDQRSIQIDHIQKKTQRRLMESTARFNQALAAEQATQKRMQKIRDMEDEQAEIYNAITSDFLTENPNVSASNLGPNRINGALYKGLTPQQKQEIQEYNQKLIEENKLRKEVESKLESDWLELTNGIARSVTLTDRDISRKRRDLEWNLREFNKTLGQEQSAHNQYMEKVVYTNTPTAAYYEQFNTTTR
uniref:RIB43A-like with coiled-coils protein 2 n=2 Tax=Clastoptera arizonana TaxID=38151 RepID=A0A1B6BY07_9HEMI